MKSKILLFLIIALALILRVYQVSALPLILNRDEAALAYNAYLLEESGLDEWQQTWPIAFKSFGDYKLPGYIYTLVALFKFVSPSDLVVRLPSVAAGTVIVFLGYFLAKKIFKQEKDSLLVALILAVLPVGIFYSRMAWEANLGLMFSLIAVILWLFVEAKNISQRHQLDAVGLLFCIFSVLTYNAPLLYLPALAVIIIINRGLKKWRKWLPLVAGISLVLTGSWLLFNQITAQKSGITIFTDSTVRTNYVQYRQTLSGLKLILFGSQYAYWFKLIINNLWESFSPQYLITRGGSHPWHSIHNHSHLYWSVYFLGLVGIIASLYAVIKTKLKTETGRNLLSLIWLLFASLLPSIVTVDAPHATRSLLFFIIMVVLAVIGLRQIGRIVKNKLVVQMIFISFLALESSIYFKDYFIIYPQQQTVLQPGFDIAMQETYQKFKDEPVAVVADGYQYILAAWYLKLDSQTYFLTNIRQNPDTIGLSYGQQVANYRFIADREDRSETEHLLLFWDENKELWQIERF